MKSSAISMQKWVISIYMHPTSLTGVSSMKLHRDLSVTQKTAWFTLQHTRETLGSDDEDSPMGGLIEVDINYVGGTREHAEVEAQATERALAPSPQLRLIDD